MSNIICTSTCVRLGCQLSGQAGAQSWGSALPDGGFLLQISKIMADLKVIWREKNISDGLSISGGFDQFCTGSFLSGGSGGILAVL
jgi:hypothetical protein